MALSLIKSTVSAKQLVAKSYVDTIVHSDISTVDGKQRDPSKVKKLLRSYARNIGTNTSNKSFSNDVNTNTDLSKSANYEYINALNKLFVIEDLPT